MNERLRLLCVLAHPDDESLGCGGVLAKCAAEGVETHLATATLGERGRIDGERPGPEIAGPIRERELRDAAAALGVHGLHLLGYLDGELDRAEPVEAIARVASVVRRVRPQVVVTFGAEGSYGHPDHIAISQLTGAALLAAADASHPSSDASGASLSPHRVAKFYWMAWPAQVLAGYQAATGNELVARVDGVERRAAPWPDWAVTTEIDARAHWRTVWRAVQCHASQVAGYRGFSELSAKQHEELWGRQCFVRVWSLVNGGRERESDLFAGLRPAQRPPEP